MFKIREIKFLRAFTFLTVVTGALLFFGGCLEKDVVADVSNSDRGVPFGVFKVYLTLIDADTQEPLPDLLVKLLNGTVSATNNQAQGEYVTDSTGMVPITIASAPPAPQEFIFSLTDTTQCRTFNQGYISVFFTAPVFIYLPKDAEVWGKMYQGTAELSITRELKQLYYE